MRQAWLIACAILISGCEVAPPTITHDFETFEPINREAVYPNPLPKLAPLQCPDEECSVAGYDNERDIDTFETFKELASGNTEVAEANAELVTTLLQREVEILSAAKSQEVITKLREEQLAWSESQRTKDKWFYRFVLTIVGGAAVYSAAQ